jgi:hypothetical protein
LTELDGPVGAADLAFDAEGHLVGSNTMALFKSTSEGSSNVFVPGLEGRAATRYLPNGDLVFVQEELNTVLLVDPSGGTSVLAAGLHEPFGAAVDLEGLVYLADGDRVMRLDPSTGDQEVFLSNVAGGARWVSLDRDYDGLFIGGQSDTIYRAAIDSEGVGSTPVAFGTIPGDNGSFGDLGPYIDGIGVDACGNVYVAEVSSSMLYRIPAQGGGGSVLVAWDWTNYGHGIEWGSGIGGWDPLSVYMPQPYDDHSVIQVEIGVPSKARPYP